MFFQIFKHSILLIANQFSLSFLIVRHKNQSSWPEQSYKTVTNLAQIQQDVLGQIRLTFTYL